METLEIKNLTKEESEILIELANENKVQAVAIWESKYSRYVVYDYEPCCTEGFNINITLINEKLEPILFVEWLFNKRKEQISKLNQVYEMELVAQ